MTTVARIGKPEAKREKTFTRIGKPWAQERRQLEGWQAGSPHVMTVTEVDKPRAQQ